METSRFFVANLPAKTKEQDLRNLFQDYAEIKNIELKIKENLVNPEDVKVIAFVTLNIGKYDAKQYLDDLNWQKVHGQQIRVSLAEESFLERLKREREEAQGTAKKESTTEFAANDNDDYQESHLLRAPKQNSKRTFDIDEDLGDDDVAPELMITKKRAASSVYNGRIVIQQNHDVQPIHVIEKSKKIKRSQQQLDDKSTSADQKRKESLNKMKNQYQQNKSAIQQALSNMDSGKQASKKIKFSDNESDKEEEKEEKDEQPKSKTNLFESDDEEDEDGTMQLQNLPTGKKGEKLAKMQSKQSLDPRFRIDAKFVDEDEEDNEANANDNEEGEEEQDERKWQMNILEQVVGVKVDTKPIQDGKSAAHKNKKMLRYDPSKDDHQKYERNDDATEPTAKKSKKQKSKEPQESEKTEEETQANEVSKDVFYVVTDSLQQSLRTRGEGFSLLNMFGHAEEQLEERDEKLKQLGKEKILVNQNKLEKNFSTNPFSYDSESDDNDEGGEQQEAATEEGSTGKENAKEKTKAAANKKKSKAKLVTESFFIPKNDKRLKEGAKFFRYERKDDETAENYEAVRNRLQLLIKTKIAKTKKNLTNAGYKGKKKIL